MFDEIAADLLDLTATEKGYGRAVYAAKESCSSSLCIILCCCDLCW